MKNKMMVITIGAIVCAVGLFVTMMVGCYEGYKMWKNDDANEIKEVEEVLVEDILEEDVIEENIINEFDAYYVYVKNENAEHGCVAHKVEVPKGSEFKVNYRYYMVKEPGCDYWKSYDVEEVIGDGTYVVDLVAGMYTKVGD